MSSSSSSLYSLQGSGSIMPSKLRNIVQRPRPEIKIKLDGSHLTFPNAYSTLDRIEGKATITVSQDTAIENIEIDFLGTCKTFVERLNSASSTTGRTEAFHQFLKLSQPMPQSSIRTLEAGQTLEFPFLFVVPEQMLDRICRHSIDHGNVRDAHLQLPPSLGDQGDDAKINRHPDDFAPDMANIRYAVTVRVTEVGKDNHKPRSTVKVRKILVVPAQDEQPPLNMDAFGSEYVMRSEKNLKKGAFKGKLGTLVSEAAQPKSLPLPPTDTKSPTPVSSMATIMLRFDPAEPRSQPPRLGSLTSRLRINTFFAASARQSLPNRKTVQWDPTQGVHCDSISLPSRCVAGVEWTYHSQEESELLDRRDSATSTGSMHATRIPRPSEKYQGTGFYTARIPVPITLPSNKRFVPTFHSCLVSRVYSISLGLGIQTAGIGSAIELKVPIQVSSQANADSRSQHRPSLTPEELRIEAQEAEHFFESRTLSPPSEDVVGRSSLPEISQDLPPVYSPFSRPAMNLSGHGQGQEMTLVYNMA